MRATFTPLSVVRTSGPIPTLPTRITLFTISYSCFIIRLKSTSILMPAFFPCRCTSSWSPTSSERPQLVMTETPKTGIDMVARHDHLGHGRHTGRIAADILEITVLGLRFERRARAADINAVLEFDVLLLGDGPVALAISALS